MKLLDADVTKFQQLYAARTGDALGREAARELLHKLVRQVELVYRPIPIRMEPPQQK